MTTEFDMPRLHALIDAYGGDPRRWPADEREAATTLLDGSPEALAAVAQARALDARLDALQPSPPTPGLRGRILARAPRVRRGWRGLVADVWSEAGGWNLAGPALAAGLALGVGLGVGLDPAADRNGLDEAALMQMAWLDGDAGDYNDWIELP